ncbi:MULTISPECIES: DNA-directed RNA polymerase subunit delta [Bacillaceae]|uniref:Probable DNA-directed RNA polymerase subunit delta n=1 Tax=Gottfriedia luciferensis TaxID=178774 RepID=A0ABX2ZXX2_9BACI|nr:MULTISPECIES: DNA-directed RNA polymerase subunit delta [Bacillaceae]ODG91908.1 DNA-directed RNA polymerase subunit delta [Gottfriedia luciferensis]PGZ94610.1 DNA-directed RNA polymerase subunit delta [Bacillus sp. AFS029533]SFD63039.1 DNA-directed RNA polymerase subunit delta [Bacillus sp. UNCCL81]
MSLKQYSEEQLKELSLIELAYELFSETKEPISFYDLVDQMATVLGVTREALLEKLPQFYTELNIDGRFVCLGENRWGLRAWYPYDQAEEEVLPVAKPKKKRKQLEEEDEFEDYDASEEDDFEEEELELDELDEDLVDDDETDEFDDEEIDEDDEDLEIDDEDLELEDEEEEELDEFEEEEER